jgi:hypothetical protein
LVRPQPPALQAGVKRLFELVQGIILPQNDLICELVHCQKVGDMVLVMYSNEKKEVEIMTQSHEQDVRVQILDSFMVTLPPGTLRKAACVITKCCLLRI